jgi:hypothetical protein
VRLGCTGEHSPSSVVLQGGVIVDQVICDSDDATAARLVLRSRHAPPITVDRDAGDATGGEEQAPRQSKRPAWWKARRRSWDRHASADLVGRTAAASVARPPSPASLASPRVPGPSGRVHRHRLDPGDERQLNDALHATLLNRSRTRRPRSPTSSARPHEGKSVREAIRCL